MTSERIIKSHLSKIKKVVRDAVDKAQEASKIRDDAFAEVLSKLNQDHRQLVSLVRNAKYELIFDDLLLKNKDDDMEIDADYE